MIALRDMSKDEMSYGLQLGNIIKVAEPGLEILSGRHHVYANTTQPYLPRETFEEDLTLLINQHFQNMFYSQNHFSREEGQYAIGSVLVIIPM